STSLHWQRRCHVRGRPTRSAIKGVGDINIPDTGKAALIRVAGRTSVGRSRSIESYGGSAGPPANRRRKCHVLHAVRSAHVIHVCPSLTLVGRDRDTGAGPKIGKGKIDTPAIINSNGRIIASSDQGRFGSVGAGVDRSDCPGNSVILRNDRRL